MQEIISSICPYCGCGCRLNFVIKNKKIVKVLPDSSDEVSEGKPCIKGLTLHEVINKGRILSPMIRKNKNSELKKVSWKKAYDFIYKKIKNLSPQEISFNLSGKITNEDNYIIQKFARIVLKTNNVDNCCGRLCHAITIKGLKEFFGVNGNPWKMDDVYKTDCLLVIGSNPASNYPVLFNRILKAKTKGTKLISVQPIFNLTSQYADLSLLIQPFSEHVLLGGIIKMLIESKAYDKKIESIKGFSKLYENVKKYEPRIVCKICKIKESQFNKLIDLIKNSKSFGIIHGMGITQDVNALENVYNILNLVILKNGKLLSGRGEVNVQGAGDMNLENEKGKNIIQSILISPVKAAFISGFNPAQSLPNLNKVHKNLKKMFLVQLDSYFNLTSKFADVILPTPTLLERTGTITNGERRVRVIKKAFEPLEESKSEWLIFKELSKHFGFNFDYKNEKEIFREIVKIIPDYKNLNVEKIYKGKDEFVNKKIKFFKFIPKQIKLIEKTNKKFPFVLITFRSKFHFLTGEMTTKSKTLNKFSEACCYLNEKDAKKLKIKNGEKIKVSSEVGSIITKAKIGESMERGIVGMHFHFEELLVNKLFPSQFERETFTPNYKTVAVKIEKIK